MGEGLYGNSEDSDYSRSANENNINDKSTLVKDNENDGKTSPLLPVTSELKEDNDYPTYEEEGLSGYEEQVTLSGPTPAPVRADRLYGAPRLGKGRKIGRRGSLRRRQRVFGSKKY